ncbi:MAG: GEVED domain-containing protein [Bacteroidota bacterium]
MSRKHLLTFVFFIGCALLFFWKRNLPHQFTTTDNPTKELILLGKNAYEEPVWEELLEQDVVNFKELDAAFHAYYDDENHELSHQQHEAWEKIERDARRRLDGNGNFYSHQKEYQDLLNYRRATRQKKEVFVLAAFSDPATYTMQVPNAGNAGSWKNIGPFGDPEVKLSATGNGALDMVKFHPTNPAIMYVAARNRGLWRSDNHGHNWTPLTDHFATPHIRSVEVHKANPDTMYLGGIDKIWRSADAAQSWTEVFNIGSADVIQELHADPTDARRVLATTHDGVYRTTDAGANWTKVFDGRFVHLDISEDWTLMLTADDNENIDPTISFSLDKGDTWLLDTITDEYTEVDKFYFAITETTPKQVYAYGIVDGNAPTRFIGLWKSEFNPTPADGQTYFTSWNKVTHPTYPYPLGHTQLVVSPDSVHGVKSETSDYYGSINPYSQATWISDFWVSPNNPDRLLTLREKFWGSYDGGISWDWRPSYGGSNWADNRYVTMNVAKDTIYWCNDGGIWCAAEADLFPTEAMITASGLSRGAYMNSKVVPKNGDICVAEGSEMDVSQMNKDVIMTGGQDIGQIFTRNGRDAHIASADVYRGRMKPTNDSLFHTGGLYVKVDGGSETKKVYNNINADYHNPNRMYGFTNNNPVQLVRSPAGVDAWPVNNFKGESRANTGGHGWTPVHNQWETFTNSTGITSYKAGTFEQSRANAEVAFLGDEVGNRVFITNNLSATQPTWTQLTNAPAATRYRIATHQFNEDIVVLATNAGVYISKNKGKTWAKRGSIPTGSPSRVLLDKNRTEGIYVMTSMTVYYIDESLTEWIEFNEGQPLHQNNDMRIAYYPDGDNRLYVSKYGSGVWGSPLYSVLEDNGDKPVVDFRIHGNSTNVINSGETVQLIDLSMNYTTLAWTVENDAEVHNAGNEKYPKFTLTTPGFYKVTLTATSDNGAVTEVKEHYIEVLAASVALACTPTNDGQNDWFARLRKFNVNGDNFDVPGNDRYYARDKTFVIPDGEQATFYGIDSYQTGWNLYWKAWIDYNNDGNFDDATEAIANSNGQVEEFTRNFTPPANAVKNTTLRMRVAGVRSSTAPPTCNVTSGGQQTVDVFLLIETNPTITNNHSVQSANSTTITSSYTGGENVLETGILYSAFDGNLNWNNSTKIAQSGMLGASKTFDTPLTNLEYNVTYHYQTYVLDDSGLRYSDKKSFTLAPYKIPVAESIHATNLEGTEWQLKGLVFPNGNNLTHVNLEHGENSFGNLTHIDLTNLDVNNTLNISEVIDIGAVSSYQFRIRVVTTAGETFYSNILTFQPNQTYCTTSIGNYSWWKRYIGLSYGNFNHETTSGAASQYEDVTSKKVGEFEMGQSYTLTMKGRQSDGGWNNLSYIAYIDLNNDQDFEDYNEIVGSVGANDLQLSDLVITIPTEDVITDQDLRMRIVGHEGGNVTSCNSPVGNYKDFKVSIKAGNCTGTGHLVSFFEDSDMDGFGNPSKVVLKNCSTTTLAGHVLNKQDCDDTNPNVNPNAQEICDDGIDNNCDGYTDSANIAVGKPSSNSSDAWGGKAEYANDGNTDGNHGNGSGSGPTTHTNTEDNPWWDLDLGESHTLDSIVIWNRTDCCDSRLNNFYVFFSDTPFSSLNPATTAGQSGVWSQFTTTAVGTKIKFEPPSAGRYLRVQINGNGILSLAEVQTFTCVQTQSCTFYADTDGDGYGNPAQMVQALNCLAPPTGYVANNTDFDDTEAASYPNAPEICDGLDNDNNGQMDEGTSFDVTTKMFQNETVATQNYTASQTITTDQSVSVMANSKVAFFAGSEIVLKPGFAVAAGADFRAKIVTSCGAGTLEQVEATERTSPFETVNVQDNIAMQIYPNPISSNATIRLHLPKEQIVSLSVFSANGQLVQTILPQQQASGDTELVYQRTVERSGLYYFVLQTSTKTITKKVILLR